MTHQEDSNKLQAAEKKQHRFVQYVSDENLNLCKQGLTDKDIPELILFLAQHPAVKSLDLSLNNIGDQGIADFAERNQTIIKVDFTGNNISDSGIAVFAYRNHVVEQVNFSHNLISDKGISNYAEINQTCFTTQFSAVRYH